MNEMIMKWPSIELYNDRLVADISVKSHLLNQLSHVTDTMNTKIPVLFIDTAGCDMEEMKEEEGVSSQYIPTRFLLNF